MGFLVLYYLVSWRNYFFPLCVSWWLELYTFVFYLFWIVAVVRTSIDRMCQNKAVSASTGLLWAPQLACCEHFRLFEMNPSSGYAPTYQHQLWGQCSEFIIHYRRFEHLDDEDCAEIIKMPPFFITFRWIIMRGFFSVVKSKFDYPVRIW